MTEQLEVEDFLAHFGVRGMKWGKRNSRSSDRSGESKSKPKMSLKKKIAIGAGAGAAVAVGVGVTLKIMNKNATLPISDIMDRPAVKRGQQTSNRTPPKHKPSANTNASRSVKTPSPYPMTPLIATPILDEIIKKYNL